MILSENKRIAADYIEGIKMLSNMRRLPGPSMYRRSRSYRRHWEGIRASGITLLPAESIYEQREYIYQALTDIPGITAVKPKAAFYIFPKLDVRKFRITDDEKFVLDLLKDKKSC